MKINAARPYQCMINGAVPHEKVSPWIGGDALLVRGPLLVGSRVKHDSRVDAKKGPTEGSQGSYMRVLRHIPHSITLTPQP